MELAKKVLEQGLSVREAENLAQTALAKTIADDFVQLRLTAKREGKRPPSTAEYLDTIRACFALDVPFDADAWQVLRSVAIEKRSPAESDPA